MVRLFWLQVVDGAAQEGAGGVAGGGTGGGRGVRIEGVAGKDLGGGTGRGRGGSVDGDVGINGGPLVLDRIISEQDSLDDSCFGSSSWDDSSPPLEGCADNN